MSFKQVGRHRWQVEPKHGMLVPGIFYASERLLRIAEKDSEAVEQIRNVACLPGIVGASMAMPDMHWGYGFPIGGVAAFDAEEGIISPGGVGYDINCGVRLVATDLEAAEIRRRIPTLIDGIFNVVPTGLGTGGDIRLDAKRMNRYLSQGARQAVAEGFGEASDLERTEATGGFSEADPVDVSPEAKDRGRDQLGTLGSGNHFLEIDVVDEIYDSQTAAAFGLRAGQAVVLIHCGSRGLGHQVCDDNLAWMKQYISQKKMNLPDTQLACVPFAASEGQRYFRAMCAAANFAWANRQIIMHRTCEAIGRMLSLSDRDLGARLVYDVAHNIAKVETHLVDGKKQRLVVHRKGATRAFPAGHPELPDCYREFGQPVLIPGDMGRASYVLAGRRGSMEQTFGSCCHGAGRVLSRQAAKKAARGRMIDEELERAGIYVRSGSRHTLAEEMPDAYKNVSDVVDVVHEAGLAEKVARLRPLGVIKG